MITSYDGVYRIYISTNNLISSIPTSIKTCRNLEVLDLSNNRISGYIPPKIGSLAKLSILRLGENSIEGTILSKVGDFEIF